MLQNNIYICLFLPKTSECSLKRMCNFLIFISSHNIYTRYHFYYFPCDTQSETRSAGCRPIRLSNLSYGEKKTSFSCFQLIACQKPCICQNAIPTLLSFLTLYFYTYETFFYGNWKKNSRKLN